MGNWFTPVLASDPDAEGLRRHPVICGFGRVGRELADALERRGFKDQVIEYNPVLVRELRERGIRVVYGDATNPVVLKRAHLERARVLAVVMPDSRAAETATRDARAHHGRPRWPRPA